MAESWWPELRRGDLVAYLTDDELSRLIAAMEARSFAAGDVVFHRGDPSDSLVMVEEGELEVVDESLLEPLAVVAAGGVVGEVGFLDGRVRTHDVRARGDCRLGLLTRPGLLRLVQHDAPLFAKLAIALAEIVARRFRSVVHELEPVRAFAASLREPLEHGDAGHAGFDEIDEPLPEGALEMLRAVAEGTQKDVAGT